MSIINYLGGLKREHHHLKVKGQEGKKSKPRYERAIFLFKPELMGRSFWVPDSCGWKYLEPKDNHDMAVTDAEAFKELVDGIMHRRATEVGYDDTLDREAIKMAIQMNTHSGILFGTAFSLVRCCQLLEIEVCGPALAQLLMFIQDGIQEMGSMPMPEPDKEVEMGEIKYKLERLGETKTIDAPLTVTESELKSGILGG